jgi:hypothetical protein
MGIVARVPHWLVVRAEVRRSLNLNIGVTGCVALYPILKINL